MFGRLQIDIAHESVTAFDVGFLIVVAMVVMVGKGNINPVGVSGISGVEQGMPPVVVVVFAANSNFSLQHPLMFFNTLGRTKE